MASVAFTGLASGLNSGQLIDAMLSVQTARVDALKARKTSITSRVSTVGTLRSKLNTLISRLEALRFQSQIMTRTVTSSNAEAVSATADNNAVVGPFDVTVDQLATATSRSGATGVGLTSFDPNAALGASGLLLTPTAGRFTINGVSVDVAAPTSIQDFVDAINAQTASHHVTASYVLDGGGQPAGLRLENDGTQAPGAAIQLGTAADTSNFLTATKLTTSVQVGEARESTTTLGRLIGSATLDTGRLATALTQTTGSFTINGIAFDYDSSSDSVNSLIAEINASNANVTASYDSVSNRLSIAAKVTGAQSITVADTSGNLMAALGLTDAAGATETLGQNALYRISTIAGGAQQSSTTNVIGDVLQGVSLTLKQASATPVTMAVSQNGDKPLAAMKDFVAAYNDVTEFIRTTSRPDANQRPGPLQSETGIRLLGERVRSIATSQVAGLSGPYSTLSDLGLTFGAVGSAVGTTNKITLDEAKFTSALQANPSAVHEVLNSATVGSEGIFGQMRSHLNVATLPGGALSAITDTANSSQTDLDYRIRVAQERIDQRRTRLEAQFARMESALARLQSQASRLGSQLSSLNTGSSGQ